jgi:hypothetical protein
MNSRQSYLHYLLCVDDQLLDDKGEDLTEDDEDDIDAGDADEVEESRNKGFDEDNDG